MTERFLAEAGDRAWDGLLAQHRRLVRAQLVRFRGSEVDTAEDGLLATFDGPARAVRCASAIVASVRALGVGGEPASTPARSSGRTRACESSPARAPLR